MKTINAERLNQALKIGEVILIDVREPIEYEIEHIKDARLIPLSTLKESKIPFYSNKKVVVYCKGGARGESACSKLNAMNLGTEVYNLKGGITAWKEKFETVKSARRVLPLDRQMQIIIGSGVLTFTLLGIFVNTKFLFISGFFGAGLMFAGLTGFCALIKILSLLPWNKSALKSSNFKA